VRILIQRTGVPNPPDGPDTNVLLRGALKDWKDYDGNLVSRNFRQSTSEEFVNDVVNSNGTGPNLEGFIENTTGFRSFSSVLEFPFHGVVHNFLGAGGDLNVCKVIDFHK
jgi:hypothetical protein